MGPASMLAFQLIASAASLGATANSSFTSAALGPPCLCSSGSSSSSGGSGSGSGSGASALAARAGAWHAPQWQQYPAAVHMAQQGVPGAGCCVREVTPPPATEAGALGPSAWPASDDASPLSSGTPLVWGEHSCILGEPCALPAVAPTVPPRAAKRARGSSGAGDAGGHAAPSKQPARLRRDVHHHHQQQQQQQQEDSGAGTWEPAGRVQAADEPWVQHSEGSASSTGSRVSAATAVAGHSRGNALVLDAGSARQLLAAGLQLGWLRAGTWAAELPTPHQEQQPCPRAHRGSAGGVAARAASPAAAAAALVLALRPARSPPAAELDAALAWAGGVLGVCAREPFSLARHMWARAAGRVDDLLVVSLGASQPPARVLLLAALWLASKLEGNRRAVAGASRLCAATGLSRWGVTSVEVHLLQLLDFSPYHGW